jgi:hypothetical protein
MTIALHVLSGRTVAAPIHGERTGPPYYSGRPLPVTIGKHYADGWNTAVQYRTLPPDARNEPLTTTEANVQLVSFAYKTRADAETAATHAHAVVEKAVAVLPQPAASTPMVGRRIGLVEQVKHDCGLVLTKGDAPPGVRLRPKMPK